MPPTPPGPSLTLGVTAWRSGLRAAQRIARLNQLRDHAQRNLVRMVRPDLDPDRAMERALRLLGQSRFGDVAAEDVRFRVAANDAEVWKGAGAEDFEEHRLVGRVPHAHQDYERVIGERSD